MRGFNPLHKIWERGNHKRCAQCGMLLEEILQYGLVLCPAGRDFAPTQRAHLQFAIKNGMCRGFLFQPHPEQVVYREELDEVRSLPVRR